MKARNEGPLSIPDALLRALVNVRRARGGATFAQIDVGSVRDVESALGGTIPDELLGLCLVLGRSLGDLVDREKDFDDDAHSQRMTDGCDIDYQE